MPSSVLREQYLALAAGGSVGHHNKESEATKVETTTLVPSEIVGESMVGATICFTPEPSPPNSPTNNHGYMIGDSSEGYIGSITALSSKDESAGKDMVSSVHQIASSLDGKSTTEYEILDGISSKGTLEIEDLLDEDSSDLSQSKKREAGVLEAAALDPEVTLPSINDNDSSPPDSSKLSIQTSFAEEAAPKPPTDLDDRQAEGDMDDTSPEVDETPLSPFTNLHKFWESKSPTISAIGRMFGVVKKSNTDEDFPVPKDEAIGKATLPGEENSGQVNESVQGRSALGSKSSHAALKEFLMSIVSLIASNLTALCLLLHDCATLLGSKAKSSFLRLISNKISGVQGSIGSNLPSKCEEQCSSEEIATNLTSTDDLDAKEKDVLGRINQRFAASVTRYGDLVLVFAIVVIALAGLSFFIFMGGSPAFQTDRSYEDFVCIPSKDMSLVAVPYWEFNLLSSADSFAEAGRFDVESMETDSSWLVAFTSLSIAIAAGAALIFNGHLIDSIARRRHKPVKHQTGIWTTLEHKQFLEGYGKYGNDWKAVARLVPSRSHKQGEKHSISNARHLYVKRLLTLQSPLHPISGLAWYLLAQNKESN